MKTIWLIRHAESTANVGQKTTTPETIGLTDTGREQAECLADSISYFVQKKLKKFNICSKTRAFFHLYSESPCMWKQNGDKNYSD